MKRPLSREARDMKALIDADIFQWEFGNATDSEYKPIPWPFIQSRIQGRIDRIVSNTSSDDYQLYLTSDDKSNFRYDIATIKEYKGNRKHVDKPYWYSHIRNFLVDHRGAIEVFGQEADDAISIEQWRSWGYHNPKEHDPTKTVICSKDKDLKMVPGWHYDWSKEDEGMWFQTETGGLRSFYCQLLTGDPTDNILGLFGVGKSSKLLSHVHELDDELDMYLFVLGEYSRRFGNYAEQFLIENARLLWMRRCEGEMWEPPTDVTQ